LTAPYAGKRGQRVIVTFSENEMLLDPSLPAPWWPDYGDEQDHYRTGDIVVYEHHIYRCRRDILHTGKNFEDEPQRSAWIDTTSGSPDIREQTPEAVGVAGQVITIDIFPNRRLYVDTRNGAVNVRLPKPSQWVDGDAIEIVDDYRTFDKNPCTLLANDVQINGAYTIAGDVPPDLPLDSIGSQDFWRFSYYINRGNVSDQWLYTVSAPGYSAGGVSSASFKVVDGRSPNYKEIKAWDRVMVGAGDPLTIPLSASLRPGDVFQIVDKDRSFSSKNYLKLALPPTTNLMFEVAGPGNNLILDAIGQNAVWGFLVTDNGIAVMSSA
jgi:hypothetical protein